MELTFLLAQLITPAAAVVLLGPLVVYLIARWRASKEPVADPQLGLKFALYYFSTVAFHVTLIGTTLLVYTLIKAGDEGGSKSQMYRMAFGFLIPGGVILGAHLALLTRTNDAQLTGVRRLFFGFNLVITGLVGFVALIIFFQALFVKGSSGGMGHLGGSGILIYGGAWGVLAWRFATMVFGDSGGPGMPMPEIVPPPRPPPVEHPESRYAPPTATPPADKPPSGGGGLPPLGGGSFPPIDR